MKNNITITGSTLILLFIHSLGFSQQGPGGVSVEVAGNSNCKMWLDAETLQLTDGSLVSQWDDISLSANDNTPTQANATFQPTFRSDASAGINGHPVLRFEPSQYLRLLTSNDINAQGPYDERTTIIALRTGSDVTTRQMIWEQGGTVRGLNIYIYNGELYLGGYDIVVDGADGTPSWNFTYTRVPVAPNTPYVISHVFDGPQGNLTGNISGYLNGERFQDINPGPGNPALNVGSIHTHPNAPGLGAINGDSYNELGPISGATGQQAFLGDMAEFIAYNEILNDAERIIIENYLGAKYFASFAVNDYYNHQTVYGNEVIGIGRDNGISNIHNNSKGRNLFKINAGTSEFGNADYEYFLTGHNGGDTSVWTITNAPNNAINTGRLAREWKVDHRGNVGEVTFEVDVNDLPPLPPGYTKYCLVVDKSGGVTSNFNSASTEIIEMTNTSGTLYEVTEDIPDGSYITLACVIPTIQFVTDNSYGFELSPVGSNNPMTVDIELNYRPINDIVIDFTYTDNTAVYGNTAPASDYWNISPLGNFAVISATTTTTSISFDILGDLNPENTEDFNLELVIGGNTSSGITIGDNNIHTFSIFDDDNTPKVGFSGITSSHNEGDGTVNIQILRSGNTAPAVSVDYQLRISGGSGTAIDGTDYTFVSGTANFPAGVTTYNMPLSIINDLLDEPNETVIFELINNVDCDMLPGFIEHTATIVDNDSPPTIEFSVLTSQGPESNGAPIITVELSGPSSETVQIDYNLLGTGTATFGSDFTISSPGTLTFLPGDTILSLPLFVLNDALNEADETVDFELVASSVVNATPASYMTHTYTIKDYTSFEYRGAAGVGKEVDNIFWLKALSLADADGANVQDFIDSSPNGLIVNQTNGANQPTMNFAGPNNKKELVFDGNDIMLLTNDPNTNTGASYISKHFTIAFTTGANVTNKQMIYEQGGATRGISVYLLNNEVYYHIWNNSDDNGANSAWGVGSATGAIFVNETVLPNTSYILSFEYEVVGTTGTLNGFLNGTLVNSVNVTTGSGVAPLLYAHGDRASLGGVSGSTRYVDNTSNVSYFTGAIQEMVYYSDAPFNTSRRIIVENHMSTKYGINLSSGQYYSTGYASSHENEMAGIGQFFGQDSHSDAKGTGACRINNASDVQNGDFLMWGHDDNTMTIQPLMAPESHPDITQRLQRVWKASEMGGDVGTVTITFDLSSVPSYGSYQEVELVLLIDADDGNFSNCQIFDMNKSYNTATGELSFAGVNLNHDQWFTVGIITVNNPLPVELIGFEATPFDQNVILNWSTASELNNDYFTIEKSENTLEWEIVGTVSGKGTTSSTNHYELIDTRPIVGTSYYRLKQTDYNGEYTYSEVRMVNFSGGSEVNLYPNPIRSNLNITSVDEIRTVQLTDINGMIVFKNESVNDTKTRINCLEFSPGVYFVQVKTEKATIIEKIVVQ